MKNNINIIFSDKSGGVFTVSTSLHNAFLNKALKSNLINMFIFSGNMISRMTQTIKHIRKNIKKDETLIMMHYDAIFIGIFLSLIGYKNIINVFHTNLFDYYNSVGLLKKIIMKFMMIGIRKKPFIFVSKEAEIKAKEFFRLKNTSTIYNIYNPTDEKIVKQKKEKIILGILARLHKVKNIDLTIRVVKKLKEKYPNLELHIYGKGDEEQNLINYINRLNCNDFVFLKGFTADKKSFFSSIDSLVSMSSLEGFGMTILESASFKTPILYTDCSSGPRELMSPNSNPVEKTNYYEKTDVGYLVKPVKKQNFYIDQLTKEEDIYVDILSRFVDDLEKDNFSMNYNFDRFTEENILKEWEKIINE